MANTPSLHAAIEGGHDDLAAALLDNGSPVNGVGAYERTPLHIAAMKDNSGMIQLLLQMGGDVNIRDGMGQTPLYIAAESGFPAAVALLMAAGADAYIPDRDDVLPLVRAAVVNDVEVLSALVAHGVNVNAADYLRRHDTALHYAQGKEMVDMLVEAGANMEARNEVGDTPLICASWKAANIGAVRALVGYGAEVNTQNKSGNSPLHFAAGMARHHQGDLELVDFLLRSGADATVMNNDGETAVGFQLAYPPIALFLSPAEEDAPERLRELLLFTPAERARRRRRLLVLCVARHRRVQQLNTEGTGILDSPASSNIEPAGLIEIMEGRAHDDWIHAAAKVVGLGDDILVMIVRYL